MGVKTETFKKRNGIRESLNFSKSGYLKLLDALKLGIAVLKTETFEILYVNKFFIAKTGYDENFLKSKHFLGHDFFTDLHQSAQISENLRGSERYEAGSVNIRLQNGSRQEAVMTFEPGEFGSEKVWLCQVQFSEKSETLGKTDDETYRLAAIVENSEDAIFSLDFEGNIKTWNKGAEFIYGYKAGEIIGENIRILIPPELQDESFEILRIISKGGYSINDESIRRKKDGTLFNVSVTVSPIKNPQGEIVGISKIARDISKRKKAEAVTKKLHKELADIKFALDESSIVAIADQAGKITYVNDKFCEISGYTRAELTGPERQLIDEFYDEESTGEIWTKISGGEVWSGEVKNRHKDGSVYWLHSTIVPFLNEEGKPYQYIAIRNDITERKHAEDELRKSEERFRNLVEASSQLIWHTDAESRPSVDINWTQVTGYKDDEKKNWSELVHPDDISGVMEKWQEAVAATTPFYGEFRLINHDGTYHHYESRGVPILEDGRVREWIGAISDVTERKHAEMELRESEARFRQLTEGLPLLVWTCRADNGFCDYLSSQWVSYTGIPESEQLGYEWVNQIHPDDRERTVDEWNLAVKNNSAYEVEHRIRGFDGVHRWFQTRALPLVDASGKIVKWVGTTSDIDDLRTTKEALRNEIDRLEKTATVSPVVIMTVRTTPDGQTTIQYVSPRIDEIYGMTPEELKGNFEKMVAMIDPEDRQLVDQKIKESALSMSPWQGTWRVNHPHRGEIWVEGHFAPTSEPDKSILWHGVLNDITERKRIEGQIIESEQRYRLMFENNPMPMWVYDTETLQFLAVNDAAEQHYGYSREEFLAMNIREIRPNEDVPALLESVKKIQGKLGKPVFFRHLKKDGTLIEVEIISHGMNFAGREARLVLANDVTDRRRAEKMILEMNETLERSVAERTSELNAVNRELEAFSYSVSHDLRAPLRAMDGFSLALLEDYAEVLDESGKNYLERVRLATQKMARLIDDLLKLSRMSRGELKRENVNLTEIATEVTERLQEYQPKTEFDLKFENDVTAVADQRLVRVALENLLGNAWKFTSKKDKAVIELGQKTDNGETIYFVKDNGAGFDMTYADKLFGAFQRLHTDREFEGTGIGLATVQRIINRHGGRIWAESEVGQGTVFYFSLGIRREGGNG